MTVDLPTVDPWLQVEVGFAPEAAAEPDMEVARLLATVRDTDAKLVPRPTTSLTAIAVPLASVQAWGDPILIPLNRADAIVKAAAYKCADLVVGQVSSQTSHGVATAMRKALAERILARSPIRDLVPVRARTVAERGRLDAIDMIEACLFLHWLTRTERGLPTHSDIGRSLATSTLPHAGARPADVIKGIDEALDSRPEILRPHRVPESLPALLELRLPTMGMR